MSPIHLNNEYDLIKKLIGAPDSQIAITVFSSPSNCDQLYRFSKILLAPALPETASSWALTDLLLCDQYRFSETAVTSKITPTLTERT
jgi:hypothetical protein